jgi:predicted metal-dependent peptidase|tara:strand:+ start:169 stop:822 length:654 start_codon:yes stop_codon:yes gene_type:complete
MTEEEKREVVLKIENALREGAILAGKTGGNVKGSLQELLTPKVDWVKCMASFAREQCVGHDYGTFAKRNRRFMHSDLIMPSPVSESIPELLVSMDTSGSCWSALPYFLGELKEICATLQPHVLHVMFWDTNVVYEKYIHNQIDGLEIKHAEGGGGTDVNCVTTYMKQHKINPTAAIVLTDGYLSDGWGKWDCPVFWALVNNPTAIPPMGKYVHVEDK